MKKKNRIEREMSYGVDDTKSGITAPVPFGDIITSIIEIVVFTVFKIRG